MLNADFRSLTLLGSSQEEGPDSATLDFEIVFRLNISNDGKKLGTPVEKTLRESSKFVREDGEWLCLRSVSSDWDRHTMDAPAAAEQELPDDVDDILEILAAEAAPLNLWLDCARGYLLQGRVDAFQQICSEATRVEVAQEVQRLFGAPPTYEQIQFHCASAGLHMAQAKEEKAPVKRTQLLAAAAQDLAKAQALDSGEQIVILGQGLLHVARGNEIPQARRELARAMVAKNHGRANVLPHLALAALMFSQQQYKEAHSIYCRALREHPGCPAEVRLGIAACRYRLGDPAGATAAYERVLDLDPTSADAMVGLATIKFNAQDVQQGLADGLKLLSRAYQLQPNHVGALSLLAHYSLLKGAYTSVLVLAHAAMSGAETESVKATSLIQIARAHHALGNFPDAHTHYVQANRIDPAAPLPHLGMAQVYCQQGEYINAATELQTALQAAPNCFEGLKLLGALCPSNPTKVASTTEAFKEAAVKRPTDPEIWAVLGELTAATDPSGSLAAYKKALALQRALHTHVAAAEEAAAAERREHRQAKEGRAPTEGGGMFGSDSDDDTAEEVLAAATAASAARVAAAVVPRKLLNNAAVLLYRSGDVSSAMELMEEAAASGSGSSGGGPAGVLGTLTSRFNAARVREASGDLKRATAEYNVSSRGGCSVPACAAASASAGAASASPGAFSCHATTPHAAVPPSCDTPISSQGATPATSAPSAAAAAAAAAQCVSAHGNHPPGPVMHKLVSSDSIAAGARPAAPQRRGTLADCPGCTDPYSSELTQGILADCPGCTDSHSSELTQGILADCPGYTDCYLRLACISRAKGDHASAVSWAQKAVEFEGGHADAHALMAELHMERREWDKADMHLKKLVQDTSSGGGSKKDLYAKLASATLLLGSAPHITKRKGDEAGRRAQERYVKVCEDYRSLLASQPSNVYAANGIGATLAEMGHLEEAGAVFGEVVAAVAASNGFLQVPDVLLNQANVALANQQYASAIRLYQIALEKGRDDNRTQILLYLARAHYDSDDLRSAKSCLVRAIHLAPTDYKLRFNAALTMQEWAVRVYRKKRPAADPTKIAEFTSAADDLRSAIKFFVHLKQLGKERSRMEDTKLDAHIAFCRDQVAKAAQYILAAEGEAETNGLRRMEQNKLLEAAEQGRQSEMLRKKADERAAKDDNERRAQEARSKLADLQQRWQSARGSDNFVEAEGDAPAAAAAPSGTTKKSASKKGEKASGGKKRPKKAEDKDGGATAWGSALDDVDEAAAGGGGGGGKRPKGRKASAGKGKKSKGRAGREDSEDEGADSDAEGEEEVEAAEGDSDDGAPEEEEEERARSGAGKKRKIADAASKSAYQAAGLESSEEGNDDDESRPSRSQPDAAADRDGMDGLEDDDAEPADDSQGPSPGKSGSGSAAQRKRQRAALEDEESDEERAGPPEKAAGAGMDEMQDLFGSEDEEEERAAGGGGGEAEGGGAAEGQMDDMLEDN
ncbi:MAG: hypothetical protein WDW36_004683 [Sanguina aurantia]